ncbi:MAG TPA: hypothetical protein VLS46_03900, partial [Gaiellaceae bacterium]|nr:hypothetical protein [Gaiellaceae bacterium]
DAQAYGIVFATNSIGVVLGVQISSRLAKIIGPQWILSVSTAVLLTSAIAIVVLDQLEAGMWGTIVPLFFFITACGFGFPMVQALALANHGKEAGTAASLLGALNFGLAGLLSPIVGLFGISSAGPMGAVMAATSVVSIASLWLIVRPRTVPPLAR